MAEATGRERLFEVAERLYDAMKARIDLPVNVDFFSAVVYDALGIPADLCTSIFAIGASPAGARTPWSSTRTTGSSGRARTTSASRRAGRRLPRRGRVSGAVP